MHFDLALVLVSLVCAYCYLRWLSVQSDKSKLQKQIDELGRRLDTLMTIKGLGR